MLVLSTQDGCLQAHACQLGAHYIQCMFAELIERAEQGSDTAVQATENAAE